jgi:2-polyprenyl-6-methoxyphenol hydroxylase-like FAD-dependent oxidoreductase
MLCGLREHGTMRIEISGGGPAGLYFASLAQKSFPAAVIEVVERNAPTTPSASASCSRTRRSRT